MNDKKIYHFLQELYPELESLKIPKKEFRRDFDYFYEWLYPIKIEQPVSDEDSQGDKYRGYFLSIDRDQHMDNGIDTCAVFQDLNVDVNALENRIENRTEALFEHYEKYKDLLNGFYALRSHVYDVVLEEIYNEVIKQGYAMLLIHHVEMIWMVVPNDPKKISKFIKLFTKQFVGSKPRIELYERGGFSSLLSIFSV